MKNPISHTSAVLAGVCFLVLLGLFWIFLGDWHARSSFLIWEITAITLLTFVGALISYFRPTGVAALASILAASLLLLAGCAIFLIFAWQVPDTREWLRRMLQVLVMLLGWFGWVALRLRLWKRDAER